MTQPFPSPAIAPLRNLCFVLINRTKRADIDAFLPQLRDALDESLNEHFAPHHGGSYAFRVAKDPADRQTGEVAINVRDATADDPQGALGWHQVTDGVPDIEIPMDAVSGLTGDGESLDVVTDHEVKETAKDPGANALVDNGNNVVSAMEACDRVQTPTYKAHNGLGLSNFLTPAAWIPGAPGPYDYLGQLPSQLDAAGHVTMTSGSYDIEGTSPVLQDVMASAQAAHRTMLGHAARPGGGGAVALFANAPLHPLRLARMRAKTSRAYRLGVRV